MVNAQQFFAVIWYNWTLIALCSAVEDPIYFSLNVIKMSLIKNCIAYTYAILKAKLINDSFWKNYVHIWRYCNFSNIHVFQYLAPKNVDMILPKYVAKVYDICFRLVTPLYRCNRTIIHTTEFSLQPFIAHF